MWEQTPSDTCSSLTTSQALTGLESGQVDHQRSSFFSLMVSHLAVLQSTKCCKYQLNEEYIEMEQSLKGQQSMRLSALYSLRYWGIAVILISFSEGCILLNKQCLTRL